MRIICSPKGKPHEIENVDGGGDEEQLHKGIVNRNEGE